MQTAFWLLTGIAAYVYAGYPAVLCLIAALRPVRLLPSRVPTRR